MLNTGCALWGRLLVIGLLYMLCESQSTILAILGRYVSRDLELSATQTGMAASCFFWGYLASTIPAGIIADRIPLRFLVTASGCLLTLGTLWSGLSKSLIELMISRILIGGASSLIFAIASKFISIRFGSMMGVAMGIIETLGSTGNLLSSGPTAVLLSYVPWRYCFYIAAIAMGSLSFGALVLISEFVSPELRKPAQAGIRDILLSKPLWAAFITNGCLIGSWIGWCGYSLLDLLELNMSYNRAVLFLTVSNIALLLGTFIIPASSYRFFNRKRKPLIVASCTLYTLVVLALWLTPSRFYNHLGFIIPTSILHGISPCGFVLTLVNSQELFIGGDEALASSFVNASFPIFVTITELVIGAILDSGWSGDIVEGIRIYPSEAHIKTLWFVLALACIGTIASLCITETGGISESKLDEQYMVLPSDENDQA